VNIALFASGPVGCRAAAVLAQHGTRPACVVLDQSDHERHEELLAALGAPDIETISSDVVDEPATLDRLHSLGLDLGVLAWWPHIIPTRLIRTARLGFLNFHPSLLPHNRGKDPNFWALIEEAPFGVTLHFIDERIDAGPIAFQREIPVTWQDTGGSLYERATDAIIDLFSESLERIVAEDLPRMVQDESAASFHRRDELDAASRIDLDAMYTARQLLNLVRARTFPGHPAAWFVDGDSRYEVRVEIRRVDD
jgi:methionyl-tRNA formyltransferase